MEVRIAILQSTDPEELGNKEDLRAGVWVKPKRAMGFWTYWEMAIKSGLVSFFKAQACLSLIAFQDTLFRDGMASLTLLWGRRQTIK